MTELEKTSPNSQTFTPLYMHKTHSHMYMFAGLLVAVILIPLSLFFILKSGTNDRFEKSSVNETVYPTSVLDEVFEEFLEKPYKYEGVVKGEPWVRVKAIINEIGEDGTFVVRTDGNEVLTVKIAEWTKVYLSKYEINTATNNETLQYINSNKEQLKGVEINSSVIIAYSKNQINSIDNTLELDEIVLLEK